MGLFGIFRSRDKPKNGTNHILKTIATIWNKSYKYIYIVSAKTYIMEEQYETYRSD